jgi:PAB-dependent poly(A)-specific ribonuclease subunit 3
LYVRPSFDFARADKREPALVVAYEYYPNAQTLFEMHIKQKPPVFQHGRLSTFSAALPEATLWSYMIQIASAVKVVHEAGLAVRMVDATKIIVTGKNKCVLPPRI